VEYFLIQQVIGNHGFGQAVVPTASDGGALLVGSSFVPDTTLKYSFFIRLNAQGDTVWARAYHAPNQYFQATGGIAIPNGEFIILGRTFVTAVEAFVGGNFTLTKLDNNGNVLWHKEMPGLATHSMYSPHCFCTQDGGFVMAANIFENNVWKPMLVRINQNGDVLWSRAYQTQAGDVALINKAIFLPDGGYAFVGLSSVAAQAGARILVGRTDAQGEPVWVKHLALTSQMQADNYYTAGVDMLRKEGGGFLVLGMALDSTKNELALLQLNDAGEVVSASGYIPASGKVSVAGALGGNAQDIGNILLTLRNFTHALHKTPVGYLLHMTTGTVAQVDQGNGNLISFYRREAAFLSVNTALQPQWLRTFHSIDINNDSLGFPVAHRVIATAATITATGDLYITGGGSQDDISAYQACVLESGPAQCTALLPTNNVAPFLIKANADLRTTCVGTVDMAYSYLRKIGLLRSDAAREKRW
jgi:hypothetical protein